MTAHQVVSREAWLAARKALLAEEKALTERRDALAARRRALPWVRVEKDYRFRAPEGEVSLADLFGGASQLIVYHFMFAPDWQAGCKSCSFWMDSFNGTTAHLKQRDASLVLISRAPLEKLEAASLHTNHKNCTPELIRELHARGYKVMLYTVNEIDTAQRWLDAGADGLFTDNLREFAARFPQLV